MPATTRAATRLQKLGAAPHNNEPMKNVPLANIKVFFRPIASLIRPSTNAKGGDRLEAENNLHDLMGIEIP